LASNSHASADENSHNCCLQVHFLSCRYAKNTSTAGALAQTPLGLLTVLPRHYSCHMSLYWNVAGLRQSPGKCFWGAGKVLELCNEESGNPECEFYAGMINVSIQQSVRKIQSHDDDCCEIRRD